MIPEFLTQLANHLWQSTLFAGAAGLLAFLLRKNRAAVRYRLWLAASLKFLVPFSFLVGLGSLLEWPTGNVAPPTALVDAAEGLEGFSQPFTFTSSTTSTSSAPVSASAIKTVHAPAPGMPAVLFLVWLAGFVTVGFVWLRAWWNLRLSLRTASTVNLDIPDMRIPVRMTMEPIEPSIVGIFRPALLLPKGLVERLTPVQVEAIVAHELCHARRRDNLAAAIHMMVETVFWFHPLVWWIERRLIEERERACDEEVLRLGSEPQAYAEGILNVCKFYKEAPLTCVSGVTGANLKKRMEDIMRNRTAHNLSRSRAVFLALAAIITLAGPIVMGVVHATAGRGRVETTIPQQLTTQRTALPTPAGPVTLQPQVRAPQAQEPVLQSPASEAFDVVSIRPGSGGPGGLGGGLRGGGARGGGGLAAEAAGRGGPIGGGAPCRGLVQLDPSRLTITNATVQRLITLAYGLHCRASNELELITGLPDWAQSETFDVQATLPERSSSYTSQQLINNQAPRVQTMIRNMLADRFNLVLHHNTKETPAYDLVVVQPGRIKLSADQTPPLPPVATAGAATPRGWSEPSATASRGGFMLTVDPPKGRVNISASAIPLSALINVFQGQEGRLVIDKTGMTGLYDIQESLDVGPFEIGPNAVSVWPEIMRQLGLKLESTRTAAEVLVIDQVRKPSEN